MIELNKRCSISKKTTDVMMKKLERIGPILAPQSSNKRKRTRFSRSFKMSKSPRKVIKLRNKATRTQLIAISLTFSCRRMILKRITWSAAIECSYLLKIERKHDSLKSTLQKRKNVYSKDIESISQKCTSRKMEDTL